MAVRQCGGGGRAVSVRWKGDGSAARRWRWKGGGRARWQDGGKAVHRRRCTIKDAKDFDKINKQVFLRVLRYNATLQTKDSWIYVISPPLKVTVTMKMTMGATSTHRQNP
ncbi:uncharacterized protein PITG_11859 [Phytophthora infestans T30-4]|uniref:Uncharacterized protein n=1 Tax=Phytophthora infestans (strain T30-4) TaxID=403677 RepID=D0NHE7_PHYIT|nr:uncharacterized protein PITG_11859 [Phytophthora infestans T30-4]EEY58872.1 hypothetical protein PITG_11859 [Phytophthora infestans T30-4]|eukprot:XP_002901345.1 hypothetical protein PITG_11859 [Phytophthora infestans T30-4]